MRRTTVACENRSNAQAAITKRICQEPRDTMPKADNKAVASAS